MLDAWLTEPEPPEPHLQSILFAKVVLALLSGRPRGPVPRRPAGRPPGTDARADRRSGAPASLGQALLADYALFHLEADLRWIDVTEPVSTSSPRRCAHEPAVLAGRGVTRSFG